MHRPLLMPWFMPLAAVVGGLCTRSASRMHETARTDRWILLLAGWAPLVIWLCIQFITQE